MLLAFLCKGMGQNRTKVFLWDGDRLHVAAGIVSTGTGEEKCVCLTCLPKTSNVMKNMNKEIEPIVFRSFSIPGL